MPSQHAPEQVGLLPAQVTWQGPLLQAKLHDAPRSHWQLPSAHSAEQVALSSHSTEHGDEAQLKSQEAP